MGSWLATCLLTIFVILVSQCCDCRLSNDCRHWLNCVGLNFTSVSRDRVFSKRLATVSLIFGVYPAVPTWWVGVKGSSSHSLRLRIEMHNPMGRWPGTGTHYSSARNNGKRGLSFLARRPMEFCVALIESFLDVYCCGVQPLSRRAIRALNNSLWFQHESVQKSVNGSPSTWINCFSIQISD